MLSSKASLEAHKRAKHGGTKIICDVCASVFNSDQILQRHIRMAHEGNALFKCQHCEQTFMEKQCYEGHLNKHLNIKPYSCMTCNKTFVYKTSLSRHVVVCSGPTTGDVKEYRCHVCNAVLASKASLANHVSGVHGGKKTCACGREFNWSSSLCRHVKSCTIVTQMVLNKEVISGSDLLSNNSLFGGQL